MANNEDINIRVKIDGIDGAIQKVNNLKKTLNENTNSNPFEKYSESTKGFTTKLDGLKGSLSLLPAGIQNVIGSIQTFSRALLTTPLAWVLLAITAVVGALTLLGKAFIGTDSGGLKFAILMKQIAQVVDVVMNRLAELAKGIVSFLSGNFKQGIEEMGSAFNGLSTEINNATTAAREYAIAMDELEDRKNRFISSEAEINAAIAKNNFIAADQTKSSKERMNALLMVQELEKQIANERTKIATDQFNADLLLAANSNGQKMAMMLELVQANETTFNELMKKPLYANLWDSKEFQDNFKKLEDGYAAILNAQASYEEGGRRTQMRITGFQKEEAAAYKAAAKAKIDAIQAAAEAEWKSSEKSRQLDSADAIKKRYEIRRNALLLSQDEIMKTEEMYAREELTKAGITGEEQNKIIEKTYQDRLALAGKYGKAINEELESYEPEVKPQGTPMNIAPTQDEFDTFWGNLDTTEKKMEAIRQAALEAAQAISDGVFQAINGSINKAFENAMDQLQKTYEKEYEDLEKLKDKKLISDTEYNKRKDKLDKEREAKELALKKEKAKKDKEAAIIQALINTALAVTAAMTTPGAGIALGIIAGALGLIQVALIAAQPLAYKMGGMVGKKYATGGVLNGPSHDLGGIPIVAEGGEYIIRKDNVNMRTLPLLNAINNNGSTNTTYTGINPEDMASIAKAVTSSITSIPVINVESDFTRVQKKVSTVESAASW